MSRAVASIMLTLATLSGLIAAQGQRASHIGRIWSERANGSFRCFTFGSVSAALVTSAMLLLVLQSGFLEDLYRTNPRIAQITGRMLRLAFWFLIALAVLLIVLMPVA